MSFHKTSNTLCQQRTTTTTKTLAKIIYLLTPLLICNVLKAQNLDLNEVSSKQEEEILYLRSKVKNLKIYRPLNFSATKKNESAYVNRPIDVVDNNVVDHLKQGGEQANQKIFRSRH